MIDKSVLCFISCVFCFQVMPKGKGLLSQGVAFSTSLFTDVAGVAVQGVRQVSSCRCSLLAV